MAVVRTSNNKLVGGFSPLPLVYHDEDELEENGRWGEDKTNSSFIFNITQLHSYNLKNSKRALKYLPQQAGPSFGVDLQIGAEVTSSIGHSYECDAGVSIDSM